MADLERLVLNLHTMGDIAFINAPENTPIANPDYPEQHFLELRTGRRSPFYINTRDMTGFSKEAPLSIEEQRRTRKLAVTAFCEVLDEIEEPYDHLYGLPQAMTPMAAMVAHELGVSNLWGRVGEKKHGMSSPIQGRYALGDTVTALDNTITEGGTMLDAADTLRSAVLRVPRLAVLIDREDGGRLNLLATKPKIELSAAIGMRTAIAILTENGRINTRQQGWAAAYYEKYGADKPANS